MKKEIAILANGCFWCTEAVFQRLEGVQSVLSGYTGGQIKNPAYREVCRGITGHAEGLKIEFDPEVISFEQLLEVFFATHDPTTLNRQGNDIGTQYRSAVFFHDSEQQRQAESYKDQLDNSGVYPDPIVTEITKATTFYVAEDHHQNYFNDHGHQPYCRVIIQPKVETFRQSYGDKLKR